MHRAKLDNNNDLHNFCQSLEEAIIKTVEDGKMTKDLALCIHGKNLNNSHYLETSKFLDAINIKFQELNK
jgi:isocitrate dehydrogenase